MNTLTIQKNMCNYKTLYVQLNIHHSQLNSVFSQLQKLYMSNWTYIPAEKKMLVSGTNFCMQNTNLWIVGYW